MLESERNKLCPPCSTSTDSASFFSNDHAPMHVHVQRGGGEASFEVRDGIVELRESVGLKVSELRRAEEIALEHRAEIERKWHEHFG